MDLFDSYDYFLSVLNNENEREHLEELSPKAIHDDERYQKLRKQAHTYQDALTEMFFKADTPLKDFTMKFGVF